LAKHPNIFSKNYISTVGSAEKSGALSQALHELADHIEGDIRIGRGVISQIYPLIIVSAALGLILYLFHKVIPQLFDLF
ncbi:MAG: type II secretion system F family protein, partial [Thermodesulfobacteriota bacterium]|nr:type II secretion system F family protein [Thermodesulfobacteriota bacterium]